MQALMLPPQSLVTPGFVVNSAYVPAQEVGGDFFQIFPGEDRSLLVVVGDVSGKGVRAAMLVSLITGILRELALDTRRPAELLDRLNRQLAGRTDGRFATCCATLLRADGLVTIAGARLVFVSDGVVEARNGSGELYGFERTRAVSVQTTAEIVRKAKEFGQDDDITVIGIEREAEAGY